MEQRNKSNSDGPWHALYSQCKKLVGPFRLGMLDYLLGRRRDDALGAPFNGQKARQELFCQLLQACRPAVIIETGTYLGSSTEFMAECSRLPVYSVEANAISKLRICKHEAEKT